jgi:transcriptional regulator with XRE-family HTH domain
MAGKIEVQSAGTRRAVAPARVSSGNRGRPIADLVEQFERANPDRIGRSGLSSAALRAGDLIRDMRKAAGLSQAALANEMGVKQSRISELEAGIGSQGPTWDVMERVAKCCGRVLQVSGLEQPQPEPLFPLLKKLRRVMRRPSAVRAAVLAAAPAVGLRAVAEQWYKEGSLMPISALSEDDAVVLNCVSGQAVQFAEVEGHRFLLVELPETAAKISQPILMEAIAYIKPQV